jgi:hypothetical protein
MIGGTEKPRFPKCCVKLIAAVTNMLEEELNIISLNLGKYQGFAYKMWRDLLNTCFVLNCCGLTML